MRARLVLLVALSWGCDEGGGLSADAAVDAEHPDASVDAQLPDAQLPDAALPVGHRTRLVEQADFDALAVNGVVKYLAPLEGQDTGPLVEPCYFQDMNLYPWHLEFLRSFPVFTTLSTDDYTRFVLRANTRRFYGGSLGYDARALHPLTGEPGVWLYTIYAQPVDGPGLRLDDLRAVFARLSQCAPLTSGQLGFLPEDVAQVRVVQEGRAALAAEGIAVVLP